jgi:hypothetical protein
VGKCYWIRGGCAIKKKIIREYYSEWDLYVDLEKLRLKWVILISR